MTYEQLIADQQPPHLVSGCCDDLAFIADTQALAPMAQAALERIRARLTRLGMLADADEIERARTCQLG